MTRKSRQHIASYVPFGSFNRPSPSEAHGQRMHAMQLPDAIRKEVISSVDVRPLYEQRMQAMQSPDAIRKEVTSSFDVKPLFARPCFPNQAQVVPLPVREKKSVLHDKKRNITQISHQGHHYQESFANRGFIKPALGRPHLKEENFVYIHRHNSFIDVSKMTHHDHSLGTSQCDESIGPRARSYDEVDAAMTLAAGLQTEN